MVLPFHAPGRIEEVHQPSSYPRVQLSLQYLKSQQANQSSVDHADVGSLTGRKDTLHSPRTRSSGPERWFLGILLDYNEPILVNGVEVLSEPFI